MNFENSKQGCYQMKTRRDCVEEYIYPRKNSLKTSLAGIKSTEIDEQAWRISLGKQKMEMNRDGMACVFSSGEKGTHHGLKSAW